LGVTPSAYGSTYKAYQAGVYAAFVGDNNNGRVEILNNAYASANNVFNYTDTNSAGRYSMQLGAHKWFSAGSGTAGNAITFTQAMTLDASGRLGVGTTSPLATVQIGSGTGAGNYPSTSKLLFGANNSIVTFLSANDLASVDGEIGSWNTVYNHQNAKIVFDKPANNTGQMLFYTQGGSGITERARIDASGIFQVSSSATNTVKITTGASIGFTNTANTSSFDVGLLGGASDPTGYVFNRANAEIIFGTNNIERMRIDSSGNLLVGRAGNAAGTGRIVSAPSGSNYSFSSVSSNSGTQYHMWFGFGDTNVGSITSNGTTTVLNPTSDVRLKTNIVDAGSGLQKINAVRIRSFNWKSNNNFIDFGVVAQELHEVAPECVLVGNDELNEKGDLKNPWCAQPYVLVPAAVKAIQELNAIVTSQQAIIENLTTRLAALEAK
jgi:hypothetical protein